jgi:hypothetical protein
MESEKTKIDRFLLTLDHSDIILFLPYLSRTPPPLPSSDLHESSIYIKFVRPSGFGAQTLVNQLNRLIIVANLSVFDLFSSVRSLINRF